MLSYYVSKCCLSKSWRTTQQCHLDKNEIINIITWTLLHTTYHAGSINKIVFFYNIKRPEQHTHEHLTALCLGLPGSAGTRKVKPIWTFLKQETVSGSGISWAICKSAPRSRQITTPAPHHSSFLQARCPSCHLPTASKH